MSVIECCGCSAHSRISRMLYTNRWDWRWFLCHLPHCWIRKLVCVGFARRCLRFKNSLQFCCCAQTASCCALHCLDNFHPNGIQRNPRILKLLLLLSECLSPIYTDFRDLWSELPESPALGGEGISEQQPSNRLFFKWWNLAWINFLLESSFGSH